MYITKFKFEMFKSQSYRLQKKHMDNTFSIIKFDLCSVIIQKS
jgi:hypothetical protein